jgi:putative addiction module component (TIGR02574 family)
MFFEDLKREALKLSFHERRALADALYDSMDEEEDVPESALPTEVRQRYEAYKEGKTKPLSLEELLAGID